MKFYPKTYEDICSLEGWEKRKQTLSCKGDSLVKYVAKFRKFYREAHLSIFETIVKQIWLEQQLSVSNFRRTKRVGNNSVSDNTYGKFTKIEVGISHRPVTISFIFTPIATYLKDFFPKFLFDDPFEKPNRYKYPYKHVTLDFLVFVYQMDNRLEMLAEAEKRGMSYAEFINWATNWALCYNDENRRKKYQLIGGHFNWPYIRNNDLKKFWENDKFNFDVR
jgi:hypothetical protein